MSIQGFYNTTAIVETFTASQDSYGQETKTWAVSTTVIGDKQGRSGNKSVITTQEGITVSDRFYCNVVSLNKTDRLVFSTNSFNYIGTASTSTGLTSTESGAMYFITADFSTYTAYDYAIYSTASSGYIINDVSRSEILYINNLRNRHLQIDLSLDYKDHS
jgi:head-tail adaptor